MRLILCLSFSIVVFSSCVSNKKVTLLQKNDVASKTLPIDSIVRSYSIDTFVYKIQSNDIVSIRFESLTAKEFDFFNTQASQLGAVQFQGGNALLIGELVDEKGEVPIPLIGKFKIAGLTVFEAQEKLRQLATSYGINSPIIRVRLLNYRITFLGEVNKEGTTLLSTNRVTMLEAIGLAGGLGELADRSKVKLIRQNGNETEVVYLNLLDESFIRSPYYYTYQNDVIIVPALKQR
ncbi:MAG: polysaccharide export protein, partial [Cyclobacteriaceae bacterium]|nr:polysaccharide export protein [Cyclobacteriaceae bacterium]